MCSDMDRKAAVIDGTVSQTDRQLRFDSSFYRNSLFYVMLHVALDVHLNFSNNNNKRAASITYYSRSSDEHRVHIARFMKKTVACTWGQHWNG